MNSKAKMQDRFYILGFETFQCDLKIRLEVKRNLTNKNQFGRVNQVNEKFSHTITS